MDSKWDQLKKIAPFLAVLVVIFLAVLSGVFLILLFITKHIVIDTKNVNLLDMMIKSSFTLFGSTLSGLVAVFIFSMQERSKRKEKLDKESHSYEQIKREFESNLVTLKKISKIFREGPLDELADELTTNKEVKEVFLVVHTQLSFKLYSDFLKELKDKKYEDHIRTFNLGHQIYKYLDIIINKLENKDNIYTILKLIKNDMAEMKELYSGSKLVNEQEDETKKS